MYIYIYVHIYMHIYIYIYIHTFCLSHNPLVSMEMYVCIFILCMYKYVCTYVCIYVCTYVCIYVCVCIHIHIYTHACMYVGCGIAVEGARHGPQKRRGKSLSADGAGT